MGSDESHLNVSLTVTNKVTGQCPQTTTFEERGEPKRIRTEVPLLTSPTPYGPLGQAGSLPVVIEYLLTGDLYVEGFRGPLELLS